MSIFERKFHLLKLEIGKFHEALADCTKALSLDPSYLRCLLRRADIHLKLEMYEEAVRDLEAAKELDPNSRDIDQKIREAKLEHKKSLRKDYYKILDVPRNFTSSQLKKGYHKAALKWHPGILHFCSFLPLNVFIEYSKINTMGRSPKPMPRRSSRM